MDKRQIGNSELWVSSLGLGCMGMSMSYGSANDMHSIQVIHKAIEAGVTLLDTADRYGWGHNEELIAKAIKGRRDRLVLATKVGFCRQESGPCDYLINGSPNYIKKACEASLKRLATDVIDLYYLHRVDKKIPIEDSIGAMADLVHEGKVRYLGVSEVTPQTIRQAVCVHPVAAVQTEYSLWERYPEQDIIPTCQQLGIGFIAYSPLGRGFLTGAITNMAELTSDDFRHLLPRFQGENFNSNQALITRLREMAADKSCSLSQLALAWILARHEQIIPIPGTKNIHHLEENLGALKIALSSEELQLIDQMFPVNIAKGDKYPEAFKREV